MTEKEPRSKNGFRWTDADAYLFDVDGTLLISRDRVHRNALYQAMREIYGIDTTIDGIAYHGKTDLGILRAALEREGVSSRTFEQRLPRALEVVRREVEAKAAEIHPNVFDGIVAVLRHLKTAGKLLGVASGNLEAVGWHKVRAARLRDFFSFGCFSDQHEHRSEVFQEAATEVRLRLGDDAVLCFVGDTPEDIKAARHAKARVIAVGTGIFKPEELADWQPDICVASCTELLSRGAEDAFQLSSPADRQAPQS